MFGLENKKKKPNEEFVFELEKELKDPTKSKEIKQRIEKRLQKIQTMLRIGDDPQEIERLALLLQGYHAFVKVMARTNIK